MIGNHLNMIMMVTMMMVMMKMIMKMMMMLEMVMIMIIADHTFQALADFFCKNCVHTNYFVIIRLMFIPGKGCKIVHSRSTSSQRLERE